MDSSLHRPAARRAALAFIFVTVLIDVLAFGVIIPVLPHLVEEFAGGDTATAAYWIGAFGFAFAAIQFVSSPVQGAGATTPTPRSVALTARPGVGAGSCVPTSTDTFSRCVWSYWVASSAIPLSSKN